ncbi:MAG TPA: lipocalin family protein [Granulicella sp.]
MRRAKAAAIECLLALLLVGARPAGAQSVTPVAQFDLNRFAGTWYEIARLPFKRQKTCVGDDFVQIGLGDKPNRFQYVNACRLQSGDRDAWNANGRFEKKKVVDARMKISFLWPWYTKFWALAIGPEYEWALAGSPNHKNLWIFSREPKLDPGTLSQIEDRARGMGFAVDKLQITPQSGAQPGSGTRYH